LHVEGGDEVKQTNEIGMFIPLLDSIEIKGQTVTTDALLTQRKLAYYLVGKREAHYVFTVKNNQPILLDDIRLAFEGRGEPDFREQPTLANGLITNRSIWVTSALNGFLNFPFVGQAFVIERNRLDKKTGKVSVDTAYGISSHSTDTADAGKILGFNRLHWTIENKCHYILDWNWDEDRSTIRTGHGPENITRLRRFAIGLIKSKSSDCVASVIRKLQLNVRAVFDYLQMTKNSQPRSQQ